MFIDARGVTNETVVESDVCIIGAGAAGLTLAKEFIGQPFRVCLLESGGLELDKDTQSLYKGENVGLRYSLTGQRARYFGGTTNRWAGFCRPLEKNAFEYRPWVPHSGWPFKITELIPYFERSQTLCEIGPFVYDPAYWEKKFGDPKFRQLTFSNSRIVTSLFQFSNPPTNFGKTHRQAVRQAKNIATYLYANVVNIESAENEKKVRRLRIITLEGNKFWVSAKIFILATGGIENARLLLLSDKDGRTPGLGNQNDLVGRYFMEHLHFFSWGMIVTFKNSSYFEGFMNYHRKYKEKLLVFTIADEVQEREKLLISCVNLSHLQGANPFQEHVGNVVADLDADHIAGNSRASSDNQPVIFTMTTRSEQSPNPSSRVTLCDSRDRLGYRQVRLNWRLNSQDIPSAQKAIRIIGEEIGRAGMGRVRLAIPQTPSGGGHHMGTTRMDLDPKKGVVDQHCLVHGISNLYIAGSSVFPAGGASNPHLTLLALALRLADHIKKVIK